MKKIELVRGWGLTVVALVLLCPAQAFADLIGDAVTVNYTYPDISTVQHVLGTGAVTPGGFTAYIGA